MMQNTPIFLNVPLQFRWSWMKAEESAYKDFMASNNDSQQLHVYTLIKNDHADVVNVSDVSVLIQLAKSLAMSNLSATSPVDFSVIFPEINRVVKRFSLSKDETVELSQYMAVPRTIEQDFYSTDWRVVAGVSAGLQTHISGLQETFIFVDMDAGLNRKLTPSTSCLKVWEGFPDADGELVGVKPALSHALAMAAAKEMYEAIVSVMKSGVQLPESVQAEIEKAFDKANGDYFYKTEN